MCDIEIKKLDGTKVVLFSGKIDTTNALEVEEKIISNLSEVDDVIFDFENLEYISSAGLRFVLKIQKRVKSLEIINVSRDVYEVFDMTGFSQIIKIKKALRVLSIEGKELIGEGYMGKVYRYDPETILKVYTRYSDMKDIEREIELAKKAFVIGLPTAIPFDLVKVKEGGYGSMFELINSQPLNDLMRKHPEDNDKYIQMYASLLKQMMSLTIDDPSSIPDKRDNAKEWFDLLKKEKVFDEATLIKLEKLINSIPDDNHLVHGDFHVKNIMMQGDEPLLIDMDTLGHGHPIFEITAFFLTYIGYPSTEPGNVEAFLGIKDEVAKKLFKYSIDYVYSDRSEQEREEIIEKCSLLGYMWLMYKTIIFEKENKKRFEHARIKVLELIDKYQSLKF